MAPSCSNSSMLIESVMITTVAGHSPIRGLHVATMVVDIEEEGVVGWNLSKEVNHFSSC